MDMVVARPVELTVEATGRGSRLVPALAVLVATGVVALAVIVGLQTRGDVAQAHARQAALQAARVAAANLTTIDYRSANRDLGRIISGSTGALRAQFESQRSQFPAVLQKEKSVSTGTVLASALDTLRGGRAVVLVAVDATVSNAASAKAGSQTLVKHYRMVMKLQRTHGRWLVADVAFAGVPQ